MNAEQKERAIQLITTWRTRSITTRPDESAAYGDCMTDILQELVDADDKFKTSVLAAINAAAPNARHVEVDGQPVFFSRSGDDITDTHTLTPCPHCGGSGAAEDCAPEPEPFGYFKSEPFGWTDCAETDDGAIALYTAPPAPSVLDGWRSAIAKEFPLYDEDGLDEDKHCCEWVMLQERKRLHKILAAPTPAEAPADVARDAERYRWLRTHGLQRAWVSLGTDFEGDNFASFRCEFNLPEPPNLPYEDDEGLPWADKDFDAAIDAAIEREILGGTEK